MLNKNAEALENPGKIKLLMKLDYQNVEVILHK
jgi:hypothetical protein